jgi:hypothetical protein
LEYTALSVRTCPRNVNPASGKLKASWDKVMADPRMKPEANPMPFDGKRMIYGGFEHRSLSAEKLEALNE